MKIISKSLVVIIAIFGSSQVFGFIGFGLTAGQNSITVPALNETQGSGVAEIGLNTTEFSNPLSLGGYLYIDALPFIDIEVDAQVSGGEYEFSFYNEYLDLPDYKSYWAAGSLYGTVRKKIFGLGLPVLGGVKIHAGGGMNFHTFSPQMNFDNVEKLMGGNLASNTSFSEDDLVEWVKDNAESKTGFHVQGGLQFKLLMIDTFVVYRHVIGDFEDIIDSNSFGNLNIRLGIGF